MSRWKRVWIPSFYQDDFLSLDERVNIDVERIFEERDPVNIILVRLV